MWPVIINGFGICYMLHVCVCSPVMLSPVVEVWIILSRMFMYLRLKESIKKKKEMIIP